MIVVKLIGGLGNQMFQYAAGRALAQQHQTELLLDVSWLNKDTKGQYTKRFFELEAFNIHAGIATESLVEKFGINKANKITRTLQRKFPQLFTWLYAAESGYGYQPQFGNYGRNTYLEGFWQSELYFKSIRPILLQEFSLKAGLPDVLLQLANMMNMSESVSLHVRRGDYVSNQQINTHHGVLDTAYYQKALLELEHSRSLATIYVFSDDIAWCKQHLKLDTKAHIHFVEFDKHVAASQELILMSCCRHNIIANSSFSWWGAWLNQNPEKIVIAPQKWFQSVKNPDIYPQGWIII